MPDVARQQFRLFSWLRKRLLVHGFEVLWQTSKARIAMVATCSVVIAAVVFLVGMEGFYLLRKQNLPGTGMIVGLLFDFLFLTLGVMLIFSGGLILYGSLFTSPETAFLLALPARSDQIFAYKFRGAVGFSSWAFVLLGLPVLAAYGVVYNVATTFWLAVPLFLGGFLLIPGSVGAIACFAIVGLTPHRRKQVLAGLVLLLLIAATIRGNGVFRNAAATLGASADRDAISRLFDQLGFARAPWAASHWMTRGLQAAARGDLTESGYRLALVWSHGLVLYVGAAWVSARFYRRAFNRLASGVGQRRRYAPQRIDRWLERALASFDPQTRWLILKDFRTFRRDPTQWAQVLIFVGLGVTYFANSRQFYRSDLGQQFQHGVSLINVLATSMLMCAYMGRFIYPLLSLEGRKFWILGLMPLARARLLRGKFVFAAVGALVVSVPLVTVSDLLLGLPTAAVLLHILAVSLVSLGLSGLAVGIGAMLPNFRENDPSKIAVGFGGTMNLVVGLLFLIAVVVAACGPFHFSVIFGSGGHRSTTSHVVTATGVVIALVLSAVATVVPLRLGRQSLERMEF